MTFSDKLDACARYRNMNWNEFFSYPDTYNDGQYYYICGKVVWIDGNGGGLLQIMEDDSHSIVAFTTSDGTHVYENELLAMFGTVSSGGGYTQDGVEYSCPSFYAEESQRGEISYPSAESLSQEEQDFIYGTYSATTGYYVHEFGPDVELTPDTIAGYPYTLKSMKLTYGTVWTAINGISSNALKYMLSIDVDMGDEIEHMYIYIYLDGSQVEIANDYYEKVN